MTLVGTKVKEGTTRLNGTIPTETDTLFLAIKAERGRTDIPQPVENMAQLKAKYGDRYGSSLAYDYLDYCFRQGLQRSYLQRYVGPAAVAATTTIVDNTGTGIVFTVVAVAEGAWYNGLNVDIVVGTGAERSVKITHDTDPTVNESSGFYTTNADLINWAQNSDFIRLNPGAAIANQPVAQSKNVGSIIAGTDDLAGIVGATRQAALAKFSKDLGPGMVAFADATTSTDHGYLLDHGAATGERLAIPDPPDLSSKSAVLALGAALRSHVNASWGVAIPYPWFDMDGLTPNSYRAIPPSAGVVSLLAKNESEGVSLGQGAIGDFGVLDVARRLRTVFPLDQDREDLNEGGINLIHSIAGTIRIYGVRSLVNPVTNTLWKQYTARRVYIAISAQANAIMQKYVGRQIDGQRLVFKQLEGELTTMLERFYAASALYGATSAEAYSVDTDSVNDADSIRDREINAQIEFVPSPSGESVTLTLINNQIPR